jgi:membrane protease YdiL (CAAX protease family)
VSRTAFVVAVLITIVFSGARALIYAGHPVFDPPSWVARDLLMTGPRLAACAACWAALIVLGGPRRWGWTWSAPPLGVVIAIGAVVGVEISSFGRWGAHTFTDAQILQNLWLTVFVACWEEVCYRGLAYRGLLERFDPATAAILSSLLFMVMHVQAQSLDAWPMIFAYGMMSCAAAQEGLGLPWLILAHWVADVVVFALRLDFDGGFSWKILADVYILGAVLISAWRLRDSGSRTAEA